MTTAPKFGFVIEYVKDIEAAKRFHVEVLGLAVQREHPTFVQFDHFALATDLAPGASGAAELYWLVDDAEAALAALPSSAKPSAMQQKPFGKFFTIADTEGRPRYVLELAKNRPSKAV